jgi:hypothetical protein
LPPGPKWEETWLRRCWAAITEKHPDDIVVTCALRTALTKGGKGGFKDTAGSWGQRRSCSEQP